MGKNGRFGKMYGKVVGKDSDDRPGWKGPGYQKPKVERPKAKQSTKEDDPAPETGSIIPVELQQLLLNIFRDVFLDTITSDTLQPTLQDVKTALYDRDFNRAFGKSEYLEAYSVRWSPSRALCYQTILVDVRKHLVDILLADGNVQRNVSDSGSLSRDALKPTLRVACFGGGAAEVIAFGGFIRYLKDDSSPRTTGDGDDASINQGFQDMSISNEGPKIDLLLLDVAQWQVVVQKLHSGLITQPTLSKYASASAKEANTSLITDENLSTRFRSADILEMGQKELVDQFGQVPMLLTLLFTLNELYTTSIGKTTAFLLNLTAAAKPGSLLLVVDSPGSYSETTVGAEAKKYPMQWLLDHTLLESQKSKGDKGEKTDEKSNAAWIKVISEDSKWFRMPESLRYPISLENMRYQIHLYRRV